MSSQSPNYVRTSTPAPVTHNVDVTAVSVDRVRWGSVIAGIFAAISVLIVMIIAVLALGLSSFTAGTSIGSFLGGAGPWGVIALLVAFFVGGGTAARTAAVHGRGNGSLNGAMVWLVGMPLIVYALLGGVGSLISTTTNAISGAATTAIQAAAPVAGQAAAAAATVAGTPGLAATAGNAVASAGTSIAPTLSAAATSIASVPAAQVQQAATTSANALLVVLLGLGLGLLASILGGIVGSRSEVMATTTATVA